MPITQWPFLIGFKLYFGQSSCVARRKEDNVQTALCIVRGAMCPRNASRCRFFVWGPGHQLHSNCAVR